MMLVLLLLLVGPIVLGAHLLGASWELAAFIGLVFWPVLSILVGFAIGLIETTSGHRHRRRFEKRQRERGLVKRGSRWVKEEHNTVDELKRGVDGSPWSQWRR